MGTASGWPTPLDLSKAAALNVTVGGFPGLACWTSAYGPTKFAVGDPGGLSSQGYLRAGQVFLYDVVNGVPTLTKTLPNFDSNASHRGFGAGLRLPGDVDGDGKPELEISYASGSPGPFYAWMLYGR